MDTTSVVELVIAVVAVLVVVGLAATLMRRRRSSELRSRFGPEYDRTVDDAGDRRLAEAELRERQRRVARLDVRPLAAADRERYLESWRGIQAEFVDHPRDALVKADFLLTDVMRARGYPMEDFERRSADLSVDHPSVVQNYRAGRDIAVRHEHGDADTEDLRQAMIHFRTLFDELVEEGDARGARRVS